MNPLKGPGGFSEWTDGVVTSSSPGGLLLCRSETLAWTRLPLWTSCSRRIPRPPAAAGAATVLRVAARWRSTDTCRSPTWMDPPRPLFCRTAAGVMDGGHISLYFMNQSTNCTPN